MHGKKQFCNLSLNIISCAATAALVITVVAALTIILIPSAQAQSPAISAARGEKVLHDFSQAGGEGTFPLDRLIFDAAGNLYGTTLAGGIPGIDGGTVFELMPAAGGHWTEQVLHEFGNGSDGYAPFAGLIFDAAGNLYGTTSTGGTYFHGAVFELTPNRSGGWTETVQYSFQGYPTDGDGPMAGLIFDAAGNLYGTTYFGGTYGPGTAFELTPTQGGGWTETVLHNFGNGTDGVWPDAGLIFDPAGNLHGTTEHGGTYNYYGTVFELTPIYPCAVCSQAVLQ